MTRLLGILLCLALFTPTLVLAQPSSAEDGRMEAFIDSVVASLTLEEKLGQLTQHRGRWAGEGPAVPEGGEAEIREGSVGSFLSVYGVDYLRGLQRTAVEESRSGIPLIFVHDIIHGFRTIFPVPMAEAASWDLEEIERAARIAAIEGAAHGLNWTFAPMVDIGRDARWGRVVEGAGEDPYLGSQIARARVRGFQGNDVADPLTLIACAKHFVAYGEAEGGRDYNTVDISERTLHEVFLPPFEAAVDEGVGCVMGAFNEVAGVPMHAHGRLNNDLLRDEWGFDGIYVSDYTAVMELMHHGIAAMGDEESAGIAALRGGTDIDMVSTIYYRTLGDAIREGRLDEALVDQATKRVLRMKYRAGLFEDPYRYLDDARERDLVLTPEHRRAAREMAHKSMVLLKNEGLLPLDRDRIDRVAVIGELAADRRVALGSWAAAGRAEDAISVLEGIRAHGEGYFTVEYAEGAKVWEDDTSGIAEAVAVAERADVVLLVVGEHHDMSAEARNRTSLDLPGGQEELVRAIHATGKPVVAVLMNGRPLSVQWLHDNVPSILETWYLGVEMGPAVADVLFGDVNPSGKLPMTFPRTVGQVPMYYYHKNTGRPPREDDRYTAKYIDVHWTPLYPFGYGLSYTSFEYSDLSLSSEQIGPDGRVDVSVTVTNTGDRAGAEVVQLYLQDEVASVTRPVRLLRGFDRIELNPGESRMVSFTLDREDMSMYDIDMNRVVEPGWFSVYVGGDSQAELRARFEVVSP
jgi:beta-glucosidase